ncbi:MULTISPECIES: NAD(P)/FAD-dependent oxidoreductase [unclassified Agrobacterium]|uniref:NAD(P)/FAD-dependent oxidoreductase n=1 Tax=unclassified Agrobacterium TaxID=2632611 RepID=UPI00083D6529|nr:MULTISPECIES: NAD(P)/FAD-dependent oxidoreductase [unclassified Agrobacterium]AOG12681.1 FAD dependent oxidoreductase family protein [Agrobacterium sp. RAC06]QGG93615.1 FAD-dependent oxidoreductase [Agrobacterium sp. MA01]
METVECIVVGAGVVGIAIARSLAQAGREVIVLEAEDSFGSGNSSRNSEVIHAGIYYPKGSLMARLCVEGKNRLYDFCRDFGVEHKACGKLIVATNEDEAARLPLIAAHAADNGVGDITMVAREQLRQIEPKLSAIAALHSPSTGIVDSHGFMQAMIGQAEDQGAVFAWRSPFGAAEAGHALTVQVGGDQPIKLACRWLINSAGLRAPAVAGAISGFPESAVPETYFAKGNYFSLSGLRAPFSHLIYPVPVPGGLGTHLTLDLAGQARFGPDVEWVPSIDYSVDPGRSAGFYAAIRRYWPELPDGCLVPAYAGIRPKIVPPSVAKQDFRITGPQDHGVNGLIHLFGIESPGLTASLAIAEHVKALMAH